MTTFLALPLLLGLIILDRPSWEHSILFLGLSILELLKKDNNKLRTIRISFFLTLALINLSTPTFKVSLFYPVFMNALASFLFIESYLKEETLIEKFARKYENDFNAQKKRYCFNLNTYWSILMLTLTLISLYTALAMNKHLWLLWNGLISYLIIGSSILGEYAYRQWFKKKSAKVVLLMLVTISLNSSIANSQTCPPPPKNKKLIFTELRYIPHISKPVKVTGYLEIQDNENYTWETDGDYASKIEQRGDTATFYKKEDDEWIKTESNEFLDIFLEINSAINGTTNTKNKKLKSDCKIAEDGTWALSLVPIDEGLEIESIKIEGKENPSKFSMEMKNGFKSFVSYH